jgi:hypothetical protein
MRGIGRNAAEAGFEGAPMAVAAATPATVSTPATLHAAIRATRRLSRAIRHLFPFHPKTRTDRRTRQTGPTIVATPTGATARQNHRTTRTNGDSL